MSKINTTFFMLVYCQIIITPSFIINLNIQILFFVQQQLILFEWLFLMFLQSMCVVVYIKYFSSMNKVSMFSRNFMKEFPIRKYADFTSKTGSMSTDAWIRNQSEIRSRKPLLYFSIGAIMLLMFSNFHTADEIVGHIPRPMAHTFYENSIPKEVLQPNLQVIAGWQAINKMNDLKSTLEYDS